MVLDLLAELIRRVGLVQVDKDPVQRQNFVAEVAATQAHLVHVVGVLELVDVVVVHDILLAAAHNHFVVLLLEILHLAKRFYI